LTLLIFPSSIAISLFSRVRPVVLRQSPKRPLHQHAGVASKRNKLHYHRTVVPIAVGDALFWAASFKTTDAVKTKATNPEIAANPINRGSRPRLSKFFSVDRAPATDASRQHSLEFHTRTAITAHLARDQHGTHSDRNPCVECL
jgi:hypothetical protein